MKKNNSMLDEMQERKMLEIESRGYAIALWGLLAIYVVQMALGCDIKQYAPEMVLFIILCVYSCVTSLKNNIWDRKLKPDPATNVIMSIVASGISGVLMGFRVYNNHPDKIVGSIASGVFVAIVMFIICFVTLTVFLETYKYKVNKAEKALDEEEQGEE